MTPEAAAALHARAVAPGRGWSGAEIAALLRSPAVFLVGDVRAFGLARTAADEAEILMLATDPDWRRRGLARDCLAGLEAEARRRGAARSFLEVAEDNAPARALYRASGYVELARRAAYFPCAAGRAVDALVMSRSLR